MRGLDKRVRLAVLFQRPEVVKNITFDYQCFPIGS